ncbi:MAG: UDP-N-acetylmuramoylalanine--D-glutamate ligase [Gammaproteobacteria bacterium RIFCSPLOWO2_02_FULL_57_10]|nr:MAG: UDP-N-acetylmuramoylalanine--D-glutamate ligase [Gammaproteobacteria bacterium RIFCSPLOWO2_02_FULL_57_10]
MKTKVERKSRVIVGLGKTGLSCARYLHSLGEVFTVTDSRLTPPGLADFRAEFPNVKIELGGFREETFVGAAELVVSPGISLQTPEIQAAIKAGVSITGDIDIFSRAAGAPIVAVTGSNGKSTVVSLLGAMAREEGVNAAVGGNLDGAEAAPALDLLRKEPRDLYILELSSFQLETTRHLGAEAAVILNVSDDHMDRYATLQEYKDAKQRIFRGCRHAIVNRDDLASEPADGHDLITHSYGLDAPQTNSWGLVRKDGQDYLMFGDETLVAASDLKIAGKHNLSNALAALALGSAIGLSRNSMIAALKKFPGLPHRCQWVRNLRGVDYYNDSKGTNVGASMVAIESLGELVEGSVVLIAGGIDKEADFTPMRPVVEKFVKLAILIGRDAKKIAAVLKGATETIFADTLPEAVAVSATRATAGDAVLLSPACASFDMFTDFTHRGRVFTEAVEGLR